MLGSSHRDTGLRSRPRPARSRPDGSSPDFLRTLTTRRRRRYHRGDRSGHDAIADVTRGAFTFTLTFTVDNVQRRLAFPIPSV